MQGGGFQPRPLRSLRLAPPPKNLGEVELHLGGRVSCGVAGTSRRPLRSLRLASPYEAVGEGTPRCAPAGAKLIKDTGLQTSVGNRLGEQRAPGSRILPIDKHLEEC